MSEFTHGSPSWVELSTSDADGAASFYERLFGWEAGAPSEEGGGYRMFSKGGKTVAGLMPAMSEQQPTAWLPYINVVDADTVSGRVTEAGGKMMVGPMDVMDIGRMAVLADPVGAALGIWQARTFKGFELSDQPGSFCWAEVLTRDEATAGPFYEQVFGWERGAAEFAPNYTIWKLGDRMTGGMLQMTDEYFPPQLPSHWNVNFAVTDTDALVEQVPQLGGRVTAPAMDCPIGRFASFADPQGAHFGVMQYSTPPA